MNPDAFPSYLLLCIGLLQGLWGYGQNQDSIPAPQQVGQLLKPHKEIGLNATYLLGQFIPFTTRNTLPGVIDYSYKRYWDDGRAFRFGFGALTTFARSNAPSISRFHLGIRFGVERRKHLYRSWYYTRGVDGLFYIGDILGAVTDLSATIPSLGLGIGPVIGIEYHFNDSMYLSTESMLFIGFPQIVSVIPPSALFFNYILP